MTRYQQTQMARPMKTGVSFGCGLILAVFLVVVLITAGFVGMGALFVMPAFQAAKEAEQQVIDKQEEEDPDYELKEVSTHGDR